MKKLVIAVIALITISSNAIANDDVSRVREITGAMQVVEMTAIGCQSELMVYGKQGEECIRLQNMTPHVMSEMKWVAENGDRIEKFIPKADARSYFRANEDMIRQIGKVTGMLKAINN